MTEGDDFAEDDFSEGDILEAERLARSNIRGVAIGTMMFLAQSAVFLFPSQPGRAVDWFRVWGWVALACIMLGTLVTGGFWTVKRRLRTLVEDESTRLHRARALSFGFVLSMAGAIVLFVFAPLAGLEDRQVIHIIVSLGLAGALFRFAWLEWWQLG